MTHEKHKYFCNENQSKIKSEFKKDGSVKLTCNECDDIIFETENDLSDIKKEAVKQKIGEILEMIDGDIEWYESYEKDGEKDKEILQQAKAIASELKELREKIMALENHGPRKTKSEVYSGNNVKGVSNLCQKCSRDIKPKKCKKCGKDGVIYHFQWEKDGVMNCGAVRKWNNCEECRKEIYRKIMQKRKKGGGK